MSSHPTLLVFGAALVTAGALSLAGCSSAAEVIDSYRDPAYTGGPVNKVAVFWVGADERVRKVAEDEVTKAFGRGTVAKSSAEIVPTEALRDTSKIAEYLAKEGFDAILVSRPLQPNEKITYRGATINPSAFMGNYGFYSYWSNSYAQLFSPGYIKDEEVFRIDTRLYLLASRATPLWAGVSTEGEVSSLRSGVSNYASGVLKSLRAEGLVK